LATYFTYIMASRSRVLYIGVTNNLARRVLEHKSGEHPGFTGRYRVHRLVHCEMFLSIKDAIAREKQLKGWTRARKVTLIEHANPEWQDLSADLASLPPDPSLRSG
jgi:putative endonuclease